jgi:hypothetical protein
MQAGRSIVLELLLGKGAFVRKGHLPSCQIQVRATNCSLGQGRRESEQRRKKEMRERGGGGEREERILKVQGRAVKEGVHGLSKVHPNMEATSYRMCITG